MKKEIVDLYGEYRRGKIGRREFLKTLTGFAGGAALAAAALSQLEAGSSPGQVVAADDPQLECGYMEYPGETGKIRAYQARPKGGGTHAGVIVIHENRGLQPHIEDVARRVALEGYLALAPDALSPLKGTPPDADEARNRIGKLDGPATVKNFVAAVKYLKTNPQTTGKVACMGFCWGGGMTNQVAVNAPGLDAAVPFYGRQPASGDVARIKASILCHYAGLDERINAGIPDFEAALKAAGIDYQIFMYEGAAHAFFNDTSAQRYHKEAAELAWKRTLAFFREKLSG